MNNCLIPTVTQMSNTNDYTMRLFIQATYQEENKMIQLTIRMTTERTTAKLAINMLVGVCKYLYIKIERIVKTLPAF